jgi:tetratricopeptide (TPR) repeat protein
MSQEREAIQEAINRALKASNRALKVNDFNKVAEIYFRIAYMLNDLGDEEGAQNFAAAAKEFKLKNQIVVQINEAMKKADTAYSRADFVMVADNYFMISNLAELLGDNISADKYKEAAFKFQESVKEYPQMRTQQVASMKSYVPEIQSQIPSSIQLKPDDSRSPSKDRLNLNEALKALGLVCPYCGNEIDPDLKKCPKCGRAITF